MSDLPLGREIPNFIGEFETMDLSSIKDKVFHVALGSGYRSVGKFMCGTIRGPFTFHEMVEVAANMYQEHMIHPKVMIIPKSLEEEIEYLDEETIDYIEAKYQDILTDSWLEGAFDDKKFTCTAGTFTDPNKKEKHDATSS
jgi:hypothetical protein